MVNDLEKLIEEHKKARLALARDFRNVNRRYNRAHRARVSASHTLRALERRPCNVCGSGEPAPESKLKEAEEAFKRATDKYNREAKCYHYYSQASRMHGWVIQQATELIQDIANAARGASELKEYLKDE
jgi:hypothetical protein